MTTAEFMCTGNSDCVASATNVQCDVKSSRRLIKGRGLSSLKSYSVTSTAELSVAIETFCNDCEEEQVTTLTATVTAQIEAGQTEINLICPSAPSASTDCVTTTTTLVVMNPLTLDIKRWYPAWNSNEDKTCKNDGNYELYSKLLFVQKFTSCFG